MFVTTLRKGNTKMKIQILDGEYWWFGQVNAAHHMPLTKESDFDGDMCNAEGCDQFTPSGVSSKGRYIWSEKPFKYGVYGGFITVDADDAILSEGHENLKGAYLDMCQKHFKPTGTTPDLLFLRRPQYNTWIELKTNQNEESILEYARNIVKNSLPTGIFMIDGGWQEDNGYYDFNRRKIPHPHELIKELHALGFKVMVWVSPIVSSAGTRYKELRDKGYLVMTKSGDPAIRKWWSGFSAVLDFSNPGAVAWFDGELEYLMKEYGIDGFKFDAGDIYFYDDDDVTYAPTTAREQTKLFNLLGEKYALNEFRSAWNCGGHPIVARLQDKRHDWVNGLDMLLPHTIAQGLAGYSYCCPDMVGGGEVQCFDTEDGIDSELFIRWAQANSLMGMMQLSIAPWRIFNKDIFEIIKKAIIMHDKVGEYCVELAKQASVTGEPIVRHMCYVYPNEGFESVGDQFMLGDKYLVAPVLTKGCRKRTVKLPKGFTWKSDRGEIFEGGKVITEEAPLDRLIHYERID